MLHNPFHISATIVGLKLAPIILRKTSFIKNVETQSRLFQYLITWLKLYTYLMKNLRIYGHTVIRPKSCLDFLWSSNFQLCTESYNYRYFHRSTTLPELLKIKNDLLRELKDDSLALPLNDNGKLVLLEINAGGGLSNIFYFCQAFFNWKMLANSFSRFLDRSSIDYFKILL